MNEEPASAEIGVLKQRVEAIESSLRNFIALTAGFANLKPVDNFTWSAGDRSVIINVYPAQPDEDFQWFGPNPETIFHFFLNKNSNYAITFSVAAVAPTLDMGSIKVKAAGSLVEMTTDAKNTYQGEFATGSEDSYVPISLSVDSAVSPASIGIGADARSLTFALRSFSLKKVA